MSALGWENCRALSCSSCSLLCDSLAFFSADGVVVDMIHEGQDDRLLRSNFVAWLMMMMMGLVCCMMIWIGCRECEADVTQDSVD